MKQIAENRIFTVLSRSHTRGDCSAAGTFSHPESGARKWGRNVERRQEERIEGKTGSRGREQGEKK